MRRLPIAQYLPRYNLGGVRCDMGPLYVGLPEIRFSTVYADPMLHLDNLRYAFTSCLYGYPQQVANISSPCVVSCSSLEPALDQNIDNPSAYGFFEWCGSSAFADVIVTQCHECYNLTTNQVYLGNCTSSVTSPLHPCMQWLTSLGTNSRRSHSLQLPLPHTSRRRIPHQPQ